MARPRLWSTGAGATHDPRVRTGAAWERPRAVPARVVGMRKPPSIPHPPLQPGSQGHASRDWVGGTQGTITPPRTTHPRRAGLKGWRPTQALPQSAGVRFRAAPPPHSAGPVERSSCSHGLPTPPPLPPQRCWVGGAARRGGGRSSPSPAREGWTPTTPAPPSRGRGTPLQSQTLPEARGRRGTPPHAWGYGEAGTPRRGRVTCPEQPGLEINELRWERAGHAPLRADQWRGGALPPAHAIGWI